MRFGWIACAVVAVGLPACGHPHNDDDFDQGTGAVTVTAGPKFAPGHYETGLDLVVRNGTVSGAYADSVGDPAHGGATCTFTFAGKIEPNDGPDHAKIMVVDGFGSTTGVITASADAAGDITKATVHLKLQDPPGACSRVNPMLSDAGGIDMKGQKPIDPAITGFRTVHAEKAFFHDAPIATHRAAFVLRGDTVATLEDEGSGFQKAEFIGPKVTTTGFLQTSDLEAIDTSILRDSGGTPIAGKFELQNGDAIGIHSGFEVKATSATDLTFDLTAVTTSQGAHNGVIQGGIATLSGGSARFRAGSDCVITFVFDDPRTAADVTQEGPCGDAGFGAFVDVSGHYAKK